ncbi:MAG: transketolase [Candidatus Caldatribacteriaceae bacterium]
MNPDTVRFVTSVRRKIIAATLGAGVSHIGGSLSVVEILSCLFNGILGIDAANLGSRERDQFILSKGHGALALYAVLTEKGFLPEELLQEYGRKEETVIGIHPELGVPGVDAATGSLGHGLPVGIGFALSFQMKAKPFHVFVLVGDGEFNEGSNWECLPIAIRYRLDNLTLIVDRNGLQLSGFTEEMHPLEPLGEKFSAFGWDVKEVDGHNMEMLDRVLRQAKSRRNGLPLVVIARTIKGRGVVELENRVDSHYCGISPEVARKYLAVDVPSDSGVIP